MKPSSPGWAIETTCAAEEEGAQVGASTGCFCGGVARHSKDEEEAEEEPERDFVLCNSGRLPRLPLPLNLWSYFAGLLAKLKPNS
ncbi:unnamed protein product [Cuscuta campestris]|uniref:Uncharacterized protein n=1 Tax=Cuscuta campestris TaxID=132261 RepID=A0A484NM79_9ASTE|nr:unnamed protein product [Cuscuta campestris]